jgi:hypothetical protein
MHSFGRVVPPLVVAAAIMVSSAARGEGGAPGGETDGAELRAYQARLFDQMLADPDNLDLMFEYSLVSMRVEDYEAAISTLERMLIYRQDLSRVRLELGVAYFNLGSYEVAELYFDQVLADPSTPPDVAAKIARYKEVIETRTATSSFSLYASAGLTYSTNATLGPDDVIRLLGLPAQVVTGGAEDDFGARVLLNVTHVYDLQRATDDIWITDAGFFGLQYFDEESGNVLFGRIRTGPRLALDGQTFGPKLRPYAEVSYLHGDDDPVYFSYGGGAQYFDTLTDQWSLFADQGLFWRNFDVGDRSDESTFVYEGLVGAAYVPARDLVLRGGLITERDWANASYNSNVEFGLRASAEYDYDSGLAFVDEQWTLSGYAEVRGRIFDEPEPLVDPNTTRRDLDLRAGVSNRFALQDGIGIRLDVDGLIRESTVDNFDLDNLSVTLSAEYRL